MSSEIACIAECVAGQGPLVFGVNLLLIGLIAASCLLLVFFHKRLSIKTSLFMKALLMSAILTFLVVLFFTGMGKESVFALAHNAVLLLIAGFFIISYSLSPLLARIGLKRAEGTGVEELAEKHAKALGIKKPEIFVFEDKNAAAFVVSGAKKTVFLSTGLVDRLNAEELEAVVEHELMHLKTGFFNAKRMLHSVRAGFFGLIPIHLEELDMLEEMLLDKKMQHAASQLESAREKL